MSASTAVVCLYIAERAIYFTGFVLLLLAINATISCKILVKIGPVVLAENSLTNGTCVAR